MIIVKSSELCWDLRDEFLSNNGPSWHPVMDLYYIKCIMTILCWLCQRVRQFDIRLKPWTLLWATINYASQNGLILFWTDSSLSSLFGRTDNSVKHTAVLLGFNWECYWLGLLENIKILGHSMGHLISNFCATWDTIYPAQDMLLKGRAHWPLARVLSRWAGGWELCSRRRVAAMGESHGECGRGPENTNSGQNH